VKGFDSPLHGVTTSSTGVIKIRMAAQSASLSRVPEAIASLTKGIVTIFVATFTLFVLIGGG
jgi:hypothetical protein